MSDVTEIIARDIEAQATNARDVLALRRPAIEQAERLAERLCSAGVPALANGRAEGGWILVWVTVGPVHPLKLEAVLTRLDLQVADTYPGRTDYEMRVKGIDVPLYVMAREGAVVVTP